MALGVAPSLGIAARSSELSGGSAKDAARVMEIYARSPVLVRTGERVRLPVEAVCATAQGDPCTSAVMLRTRSGNAGAWRATTASAAPSLEFDLSAPASRAPGNDGSGTVSFSLRATGPRGLVASLPSSGDPPLRFFVTTKLPLARAPSIPLGRARAA